MSTRTWSGLGRTLLMWADMAGWLSVAVGLLALRERHERLVVRADVVGRRADDLAVDALLDDVRRPAGRARDHEQRREHRGRHAHRVVADGRVPVEVREQD